MDAEKRIIIPPCYLLCVVRSLEPGTPLVNRIHRADGQVEVFAGAWWSSGDIRRHLARAARPILQAEDDAATDGRPGPPRVHRLPARKPGSGSRRNRAP